MQDYHRLNLSLHICKVYVSRLKFWQQPVKLSNVAASKDKYWNSIVTRLKKAKQYWNKWHTCCQLRCRYRTLHMNCPKSTNMACLNSLPRVYFPMIGVFPLKHWALMPMGSAFNIWSRCSRPAEHEGPDLQSMRGQTACLSVRRKESMLQHTKWGKTDKQIDGTAVTFNQQWMNKLQRLS